MKRFLYLFWSDYKPIRKYLGGRWVKAKDGIYWIWFEESILQDFDKVGIWPFNPNTFWQEDYRRPSDSSTKSNSEEK